MYADQIREIVAKHGRLSTDINSLANDSDLYAAGLTSLTTVNLMLAIEERFDIEFPDHMLGRKTFGSIQSLCEAVEELAG
ncbi:MAG TPA: acyl carrier protein [Spongiibacteraceae bacterium]|nr:acyl carrier protein [Spongiibacteraceae bacterium]